MKTFNLEEYKAPGKSNTRVGAIEQKFDFKFREDSFTISSKVFNELGLADHSLKLHIHPTTNDVLLAVVGDEEGDMICRTKKTGLEKGKSFKSTVLEAALEKNGLIVLGEAAKGINQLLSLEAGDAGGKTVYEIVKGKEQPAESAQPTKDATPSQVEAEFPGESKEEF